MSVIDKKITDWSETQLSNSPDGGRKIVRDLAANFRNIKSVARWITSIKHVEQPDGIQAGDFTETDSTTFVFTAADVTDKIQVGQMIFGFNSSDKLVYHGFVLTSTFSTDTTVTINWMLTLGGTVSYFMMGRRRDPPSCPAQYLVGEHTASGATTSQTVNIVDSAANAIVLPSTNYVVEIIPRAWSANEEEMLVKSVTKNLTTFSFETEGTSVNAITTWGWVIRLQEWW